MVSMLTMVTRPDLTKLSSLGVQFIRGASVPRNAQKGFAMQLQLGKRKLGTMLGRLGNQNVTALVRTLLLQN